MVDNPTGGATDQNCPRFKGDSLPHVSDSEAGAMGGRRGVFPQRRHGRTKRWPAIPPSSLRNLPHLPTPMDFTAVELRVGTVVAAEADGRVLRLRIRLGEGDEHDTTAHVTERYGPDDVVGRQVVVVRPPGGGALIVLAAVDPFEGAALIVPDRPVPDGTLVV